jgi:hypothetical protein
MHISSSDKEHCKHTNSDSLLRHLLSSSIDWYYLPPGGCMTLEYNLVAAILKSLEVTPLRITHKHIKSHLDNNEETNFLKLPWEAQLNIIAMTNLLHIDCTVYVTIISKSVTGQICKSLLDAANHPTRL